MPQSSKLAIAVIASSALVGLGSGVLVAGLQHDARSPEAAPASSQSTGGRDAPLYYADGQIHEGDTTVDYRPDGDVVDLMPVHDGWVVRETFIYNEYKIIHVNRRGSSRDLDSGVIETLDVSVDGSALVYPKIDSSRFILRDVGSGSVIQRLRAWPSTADFAGDDVVLMKGVAGNTDIAEWDTATMGLTTLRRWEQDSDAVSADGSQVLLSEFSASPCPRLVRLDRAQDVQWKNCDVRAYGGRGSFSPDGAHLLATDPSGPKPATPRDWRSWVSVLDSTTGKEIGRVERDLVAGAQWTNDETVAVLVAGDRSADSFRVLTCSLSGECDEAAEITAGDAVLGRLD